ncbi:hypothetical protein [Ferroplasma sp.]|uniref:hypothetical protein n=1 Tax=Ferroplasma sp. TaxID=2591003 RepID=UPI002629DE26|nr:hypothetical protein [Ferroplasma sp.]
MKITFSEIRNKILNKNKNNHIFNLLKINNNMNGYKREIKHFRSAKKKNLKNLNNMIDNIDDLRFIVLYTNMIISMNKNYENLINNLKNRIIEEKFIFSIDYLNKKLPDEIIYKISTYL